jgi:hypothetical protein
MSHEEILLIEHMALLYNLQPPTCPRYGSINPICVLNSRSAGPGAKIVGRGFSRRRRQKCRGTQINQS